MPRFGADGGRIPDEFAVAFGGIAPGRLAGGKTFFHDAFRFAEQNRNVFLRVHAVADEKRHDDDIFRLRQFDSILRCAVLLPEKSRGRPHNFLARINSTWRSMALREFSFCSVPWPAMNSVVSDFFGARGNGNFSTTSSARDKMTWVMLSCEPTGEQ